MKKFRFATVLFIIVLFASLSVLNANAAQANGSVSMPQSVYVGNNVNVTVSYTSSTPIGSWDYQIKYDPSVLQYVSGADVGGGGVLRMANYSDSSTGQTTVSCTIVFKTLKIANTTVETVPTKLVADSDMSVMTASGASRTLKVIATPQASSVNTLSSLSISPGELAPAFSENVVSYQTSVPFETTELVVSAQAKDSKARVAVSSTKLEVGDNTVTVTVTAQNGSAKTYTIAVNRQQSNLAGVNAEVNGNEYTFAYDASEITPPEGFTATTALYEERQVLAYVSVQYTVKIVYLTSEANSAWFIYNEAAETFTPYIALTSTAKNFVILPLPENTELPEGYSETTIEREGGNVTAYKLDNDESGIYLIYAMANDGSSGFYLFEPETNDFMKYSERENQKEEPIETEQPAEKNNTSELESELDAVKKEGARMKLIAIVCGALAIVIAIAFIITTVILTKKKNGYMGGGRYRKAKW